MLKNKSAEKFLLLCRRYASLNIHRILECILFYMFGMCSGKGTSSGQGHEFVARAWVRGKDAMSEWMAQEASDYGHNARKATS